MSQPEPVFHEPWHAQVFAMTVHLNEAGAFTWSEWVDRFSSTLKRHGLSKELNGGDDYFGAWLETFEAVLHDKNFASPDQVAEFRAAWETAYLTTPHGDPVQLRD